MSWKPQIRCIFYSFSPSKLILSIKALDIFIHLFRQQSYRSEDKTTTHTHTHGEREKDRKKTNLVLIFSLLYQIKLNINERHKSIDWNGFLINQDKTRQTFTLPGKIDNNERKKKTKNEHKICQKQQRSSRCHITTAILTAGEEWWKRRRIKAIHKVYIINVTLSHAHTLFRVSLATGTKHRTYLIDISFIFIPSPSLAFPLYWFISFYISFFHY